MSNVHGIGATGKSKNPKDDGNEMFSQGGAQSGTGVLRPIKKTDDATSDIVKAAREQGGRGDTSGAANVGIRVIIYKNGFKVGDEGEFRPKDQSKNKQFLDDIRNGHVPKELEEEATKRGAQGNVRIDIVDKTAEEFVPPKPAFQAFKGAGFSMGAESKPKGTSFQDASEAEYKAIGDGDDTRIQIVLPGGARETMTVKLASTVLDIYQHVMTRTDKRPFDLRAGFPPKNLTDPSATVASAGLKNGRVSVIC